MRRPSSSSTSSSFEVRKITGIWLCLRSWLEQLHAVHARHLDVEHGEIDRLRGQPLQRLGAVAVAAHREPLGLERHRHRGQDVAVVVDECDRAGHGQVPQDSRAARRRVPAPYGRARPEQRVSLLNMAAAAANRKGRGGERRATTAAGTFAAQNRRSTWAARRRHRNTPRSPDNDSDTLRRQIRPFATESLRLQVSDLLR